VSVGDGGGEERGGRSGGSGVGSGCAASSTGAPGRARGRAGALGLLGVVEVLVYVLVVGSLLRRLPLLSPEQPLLLHKTGLWL